MENSLKPFSIITQGAYLRKETFVTIHFLLIQYIIQYEFVVLLILTCTHSKCGNHHLPLPDYHPCYNISELSSQHTKKIQNIYKYILVFRLDL